MCEILPRQRHSPEWLSRALAMNSQQALHCQRNDWLFIDTWSLYYGTDKLYAKDGVHFSFKGVEVLSDALESSLSFMRDFLEQIGGGP